MNQITISGNIQNNTITAIRTSGTTDTIPIQTNLTGYHTITGSVLTQNFNLYIQPQSTTPYTTNINTVLLSGFICKQPNYRQTPSGKKITNILLAEPDTNSYIPLIAWGTNATIAKDLSIGTEIEIRGILQSRDYVRALDNTTHTTYEVSILDAIKIL